MHKPQHRLAIKHTKTAQCLCLLSLWRFERIKSQFSSRSFHPGQIRCLVVNNVKWAPPACPPTGDLPVGQKEEPSRTRWRSRLMPAELMNALGDACWVADVDQSNLRAHKRSGTETFRIRKWFTNWRFWSFRAIGFLVTRVKSLRPVLTVHCVGERLLSHWAGCCTNTGKQFQKRKSDALKGKPYRRVH